MRATMRFAALTLCLVAFGAGPALSQVQPAQNQPGQAPPPPPPPQNRPGTFSPGELVGEGHRFFGTVSRPPSGAW